MNLNIQYLWSCIWVCLFFFWQTFPIYGFGIVSQRVLPELRYIMQCKNFRMIQQHIKQARARRRESEIQVETKKSNTPKHVLVNLSCLCGCPDEMDLSSGNGTITPNQQLLPKCHTFNQCRKSQFYVTLLLPNTFISH